MFSKPVLILIVICIVAAVKVIDSSDISTKQRTAKTDKKLEDIQFKDESDNE